MKQEKGIIPSVTAPRVLERPDHNLSRKSISKGALRVLYRLHEGGYRACLVGGAVRDLLLGRTPKDFDVATDATPEEVRRLFRNSRLVGRRFRLAHVVFGREIVEVATFRGQGPGVDTDERCVVDGRLVRDNVWGTIEEDAVRRDFRVNALYYDIADFRIIDYVGGLEDLHEGVLRLIGEPEQRYREDPVRMLRAARLAAKLGFAIDKAAEEPFARLSGLLADAAPARLFEEALKLFMKGDAAASFHTLQDLGLLETLFPDLARRLDGAMDPAMRDMLEQALANTDQRVREDRPVTPAFLFAVFLWPRVREVVGELVDEGMQPALAWQRGSSRVLAEQCRHVAIPRRFTQTMDEIWTLQPRFARRTRKRAMRLLQHPRFRAAYDFLLLRAGESEEMRELGDWWTRAQTLEAGQLAAELATGNSGNTPAPPSSGQPARRRRRGGRRRRSRQAETDQ